MADPTDEREGSGSGRITQLKGYCEEDGVALRVKSEDDFWTFIESPELSLSSRKFDVVATDDGNLRAVYDESDVHIGVEFFGDQNCEYVVWSADTPPSGARATMAHTLKLIRVRLFCDDLAVG